ncbi:MAG: oligosaccharide flippase family protein [Nitrospirae bacterium YQR-1]
MRKNSLIKSGLLIFTGMSAGNVINYLFQVTMGRVLEVRSFGEMNALFSIFMIIGIPSTSITSYLAGVVSRHLAQNNLTHILTYKRRAYAWTAVFCMVVLTAGWLFMPQFMNFTEITQKSAVVFFLLYLAISMSLPVNLGFIQGFKFFSFFSIFSGGFPLVKYVICTGLVLLGFGLTGVMAGMFFTLLIMTFVLFLRVEKAINPDLCNTTYVYKEKTSMDFYHIFISYLAYALLTQTDIFLVKCYFSSYETGIFSSASIIGKTVLYIPQGIVFSLFPIVAHSKAKDENTLNHLVKSVIFTAVLCLPFLIALAFFRNPIVSVLFGNRYMASGELITLLAFAMFPFAIISVCLNYSLALKKYLFSYIMLVISLVQISAIALYHTTLLQIAKVILLCGISCVIIYFIVLVIQLKGKSEPISADS